jgi:polar amino acid transport system ATP-binding protein
MMALVQINDVHKRLGRVEVLRGISLDVPEGQVVSMLGPSGCGKTTLLRCINHLETIDEGCIRIGGRLIGYSETSTGKFSVTSAKRAARDRHGVGMVFQRFNLFPHLSVLDNLTLAPMRVNGTPHTEAVMKAEELLTDVGLADKRDCYPGALSGGQQQRVAIARALAMNPRVLLFDEPTSALDPELVGEVLEVMRRLAGSGMTMIVVTHELSFAATVADRVVMMDGGVIVEDASANAFFANPTHPRSQAFLTRLRARELTDGPNNSHVSTTNLTEG